MIWTNGANQYEWQSRPFKPKGQSRPITLTVGEGRPKIVGKASSYRGWTAFVAKIERKEVAR